MITREQLRTDGFMFTVNVPCEAALDAVRKGERIEDWKANFTYRVVRRVFDDGRSFWFVENVTPNSAVYLGTFEQLTGDVRLTRGSQFAADKPVVRIAQRIIKAIHENRGDAVERAGWAVNQGPPAVEPAVEGTAEPAHGTEPAMVAPLRFLADTFTVAVGYGLKKPMLRIHYKDRRFKFYLSARGTICLKTGALSDLAENGSRDPIGDEVYAGCLLRGHFRPARVVDYATGVRRETERELLPVEAEFLERLAADPVGFIAECGKDMCRCCYCNLPLEDARSKKVGYGPVCAKRWALPWGDEKAMENAPSFAKCYDDHAHGLLNAIRDDKSGDATRWMIFADWLQEHDLPRCEVPKKGALLPRNDH